MAQQAPDVRVRLSAEGQQEIVNAFRQVEREGTRSGRKLEQTFSSFRRLLPALSFVAVTAGLIAMGRRAAETADSIGKLQQKTGLSAQTISVLAFAGRTAEVTQEQLNSALIRSVRTFDDYDRGVTTARDAVRNLFGQEKALQGLNTDQRLRKVLDAVAQLEPGAKRTGAAIAFFGKQGAELLPLMDDLADQGFDQLTARAAKLGQLFDQETIDAITRANDSLTTMQLASEGLANQFVAGLAPALEQTAEAIVESVAGKGFNAFNKLGEAAGAVAKFIAGAFNTAALVIGGFFEDLGIVALNSANLIARLARGEWKGALDEFAANTRRSMQSVGDRVAEGILKFEKRLQEPPGPTRPRKRNADPSENQQALAQVKQLQDARLKFQQAALENELVLLRAHSKVVTEEEKRRFDEGLVSIEEFFQRRRDALQTETAKELEILRQQAAAVEAQVSGESGRKLGTGETEEARQTRIIQLRQQLAQIETKAQLEQISLQGQLADLIADQTKAVREHSVAQLEAEAQLLAAQGQRFAAARAELQAQITGLQRLKGESDADFSARQSVLQRAGEARIAFEEVQAQARAVFAELDRARAEILARVAAGQISQVQGELQILELERQRIPVLQQIAKLVQAAAEATKDPDLLEAAAQLNVEVNNLSVSVQGAELSWEQFQTQAADAITSDLTNFLTNTIFQANSVGDAFRQLALSVVKSLQRIAAEMLVVLLISKLLGGVLGFAGSGGSFVNPVSFGGTPAAGGGLMHGPGSGTSDSIPAWLSAGEFVMREAVVRQPGMVEFLDDLNRNGWPALRLVSPRSSFAEGGLVDSLAAMDFGGGRGGDGASGSLRAEFDISPELVLKRIEASSEFDRVLVRGVTRNRKALNAALGHGAI